MEFTHYYGKHKHHSKGVVQTTVLHRKLQFRLSGKELKDFEEAKRQSNLNESDFIRSLIFETLENKREKSWQEEVENW